MGSGFVPAIARNQIYSITFVTLYLQSHLRISAKLEVNEWRKWSQIFSNNRFCVAARIKDYYLIKETLTEINLSVDVLTCKLCFSEDKSYVSHQSFSVSILNHLCTMGGEKRRASTCFPRLNTNTYFRLCGVRIKNEYNKREVTCSTTSVHSQDRKVLTTMGFISRVFCTDSHDLWRLNLTDFRDLLTFDVVSQAGQNFTCKTSQHLLDGDDRLFCTGITVV